jgi:hypothetical protein
MKGTVQPLRINITADNTVEQETTATESLKEQIKRIENNYISEENTSPTVTVTNSQCIYESKYKRFDFENKGRPAQLLYSFSNDITALQNENSNKVCAKTPKNSPRLHAIEEYKNDVSDASDKESADKNDKMNDRISCKLCDSLVKEDIRKEEDAFKDFYKMMRDIML